MRCQPALVSVGPHRARPAFRPTYDSNVVEATATHLTTAHHTAQMEASLALLSAVGDPVRWRVLRHLAERGTSCVCDLQDRVPVASNLLSYHLKVLRDTGLVTTARRGRWIDYTLAA